MIRVLRNSISEGCNALVDRLREEGIEVKKLLLDGSTYRGSSSHIIINWGSNSRQNIGSHFRILNKPSAVRSASNKIDTFRILSSQGLGHYVPKWTTSRNEACLWIDMDLDEVYCRTLTRASQGRGIVVATQADEIPPSPLFTARIPVDREVRVHVWGDKVIDFAQKKRMSSERREEEGIELSEDVRSHGNGWIFSREGVMIPERAKDVAIKGVKTLGLHFGAVDMILTPVGVPKILEINTAPGLEGTTLESYVTAVKNELDQSLLGGS